MKVKRDERQRIWKSVLSDLVGRNPPTITAEDLAEEAELTLPSAGQLLARLRTWGYLRLVGFEPANGGGAGRQKHVYEVTTKAQKYVERMEKDE